MQPASAACLAVAAWARGVHTGAGRQAGHSRCGICMVAAEAGAAAGGWPRSDNGATPLHWAALGNHQLCVQVPVASSLPSKSCSTALPAVRMPGKPGIRWLSTYSHGSSATVGSLDCMHAQARTRTRLTGRAPQALLEAGHPASSVNNEKETPAHFAVRDGSASCGLVPRLMRLPCRHLLAEPRGAAACAHGPLQSINTLLRSGSAAMPSMLQAGQGHASVLKALIAAGADVNAAEQVLGV